LRAAMKKRRSFESMSPGNRLAELLDQRDDALIRESTAKRDRLEAEQDIIVKIVNDPKGLEGCLKVNWPRLYRMFGA
jgi:hypothetical protein